MKKNDIVVIEINGIKYICTVIDVMENPLSEHKPIEFEDIQDNENLEATSGSAVKANKLPTENLVEATRVGYKDKDFDSDVKTDNSNEQIAKQDIMDLSVYSQALNLYNADSTIFAKNLKPYIRKFMNNNSATINDINKDNIKGFNKFLQGLRGG